MTKNGMKNDAKKNGANGAQQTHIMRTEEIQADRERYLPRGVYTYHEVFPASASGARSIKAHSSRKDCKGVRKSCANSAS